VLVLERAERIGGGCRSDDLTGDGTIHDTCATVHALGAVSPVFRELGLTEHGLRWLAPPVPLAHPVTPDRVAVLHRSVEATAEGLGDPGWAKVFQPLVRDSASVIDFALAPQPRWPRSIPTALRFGSQALPGANLLARRFDSEGGRALFAGLAAHSFLRLDAPFTASLGLMFAVSAHAAGWPIAEGGSQRIPDALAAIIEGAGGEIRTGVEVRSLADVPPAGALFCDLTPRQALQLLRDALPDRVRRAFGRYRYGPGVFKVDYVLDRPVPWASEACADAGTVHLGGTFEEVATGEAAVVAGRHPADPFVLAVQPTMFDPTRAAPGRHVLWAYCHAPSGSSVDLTAAIEARLERFAPGFGAAVVHRSTLDSAALERRNPNNVGGDIAGGATSGRQLLFRPRIALDRYRLGGPRNAWLCSASTPPGAGVHGMCGYWAVQSYRRAERRS
jgi:phytoene dehydrogenase-like protein